MKLFVPPLLFLLGILSIDAQPIMRDVFVQMPDTLLPTLNHNNRLDLIDFIDAGLETEVAGALNGGARLTELTPQVMKLHLSPRAEMQACLLPERDAVCVVHSVQASAWDSTIKFYDRQTWTLLPTDDFITLPTTTDFLTHPEGMTDQQYRNLLVQAGTPLIRADIRDGESIAFTYTSANESSHEYREQVKTYVTEELIVKLKVKNETGQ